MTRPWLTATANHFPHRKLAHVATLKARIGWQNLRTEEFVDEGPYCVTGTDFRDGRIDWNTSYHVSKERYETDRNIQLRDGDLLVTKDGTIGKVAVIERLPDVATLNSGVFVVRPRGEGLHTNFLSWVIRSGVFEAFVAYHYAGSTINHLYQNIFETFRFPFSNLDTQKAIADFLDRETTRIDGLIEKKQRMTTILAERRGLAALACLSQGLNGFSWQPEKQSVTFQFKQEGWASIRVKSLVSFMTSGSRGWSSLLGTEGEAFIQSGNIGRYMEVDLDSVHRVQPQVGAEAERTLVKRRAMSSSASLVAAPAR
jgi:type I restriction enzyme S subunit